MSSTHMSNRKWKKSIYKPMHPDKYKGTSLIVARSTWETRFMRYLDLSDNVIEWISEQPLVPYLNPNTGTVWNYHPDFLIRLQTQTGIRTQMIEIKPKKQTIPPVITEGKRRSTILKEAEMWRLNTAKWIAARQYCNSRGWDFKILTEDNLFG